MAKLLDDKQIDEIVNTKLASRLEAIDEAATMDRLQAVKDERERTLRILTDEWARAGVEMGAEVAKPLLPIMERCVQRITGAEGRGIDPNAKPPVDDTEARMARMRQLAKGPNAGLLVVPEVANGTPKRLLPTDDTFEGLSGPGTDGNFA